MGAVRCSRVTRNGRLPAEATAVAMRVWAPR